MFRPKRKSSDFGAEIEAHLQFETERLQHEGLVALIIDPAISLREE